jgi:hypothetical protein
LLTLKKNLNIIKHEATIVNINKEYFINRECVIEHAKFWPIFCLYLGSVYLGTTNLGGWAASAVGIIALTIIGAYGEKLRRYHARVRFRQGKLQRTGDGGEDCWTILLRKRWANLLTHPFSHVFKPAPGLEVTVDIDGRNRGSVRCFERPITVIAAHERFVVGIGHCDIAPSVTVNHFHDLEKVSKLAGVCISDYIDNGQYDDLPDNVKCEEPEHGKITEKQFYSHMGLFLLSHHGLKIE